MRRKLAIGLVLAFVLSGWTTARADSAEFIQPQWFEWDRMSLDVLIVPPAHGQVSNGDDALAVADPDELVPTGNSYIRATEKAIADWRRAIQQFGSASLKRLRLNVYVVGRDAFPSEILSDLEILVVFDETKFPYSLGTTLAGPAGTTINGVEVYVLDNPRCTTFNSMFGPENFTFADMYNVAAHEFGHCLGLAHIRAGGDSTLIRDTLVHDTMYSTYVQPVGGRANKLNCMSNVNVAGLELAYDGKPSPEVTWLPASQYKRIAC